MKEKGYYKQIDGTWIKCEQGIALPNTNEFTLDKEVMVANGWEWMDSKPIEDDVIE